MGEIGCWSVTGLKGLKTYCLLLIVQLTLKCTSLGLALNTTYQPRVRSLQGNLRLGSIHQGEVWDFPVMTEWMRLISYLLYVNSIKNTGSNFQLPVASLLGHSRPCSLNWNKPGVVIETTRHSWGKLSSPDVSSTSPKSWWAVLISQFFCFSNSSTNITCPSGKLKTEFTSPIAKSTSPGLSDTTFFARCLAASWRVHTTVQCNQYKSPCNS